MLCSWLIVYLSAFYHNRLFAYQSQVVLAVSADGLLVGEGCPEFVDFGDF